MPRLLLPILAAACLASLTVVLPRSGGRLSALPLPPGDVAPPGGKGDLVPAADWFEQIFRGLRGDDREREDRGNRGREGRSFNPVEEEAEHESRESTGGYFRTMCVRLCDGLPIPMSFSTTRSQFAKDARRCAQTCPAGRLFVYPNPGGEIEDMVDLQGHPYRQLPTAFLHQSTYVENCACHGNPWDQAAIARHESYAAQSPLPTAEQAQRKLKPPARSQGRARGSERWVQDHSQAEGDRR